jgi:hypothetical protein
MENCSRAEAQQCQAYEYRSIFIAKDNKYDCSLFHFLTIYIKQFIFTASTSNVITTVAATTSSGILFSINNLKLIN